MPICWGSVRSWWMGPRISLAASFRPSWPWSTGISSSSPRRGPSSAVPKSRVKRSLCRRDVHSGFVPQRRPRGPVGVPSAPGAGGGAGGRPGRASHAKHAGGCATHCAPSRAECRGLGGPRQAVCPQRAVTASARVGPRPGTRASRREVRCPPGGRPMPLALCIVGCGQFARTLPTACNLCGTRSTLFRQPRPGAGPCICSAVPGPRGVWLLCRRRGRPLGEACTCVPLTTCIRPTSPWPPRRASTSWWRNPRPHPG